MKCKFKPGDLVQLTSLPSVHRGENLAKWTAWLGSIIEVDYYLYGEEYPGTFAVKGEQFWWHDDCAELIYEV